MLKKAFAYVFIYGVAAAALVLALAPMSFAPAAGALAAAPVQGVVPAVEVTVDGRCPYLGAEAAAGSCPYLAAAAAAGCPWPSRRVGAAQDGRASESCPYLRRQHDELDVTPDGAVRAVLSTSGDAAGAEPRSL